MSADEIGQGERPRRRNERVEMEHARTLEAVLPDESPLAHARLHRQRLLRRDIVALGQHLQVVLHKARLGFGQRQAQGIGRRGAGRGGYLGVGGQAQAQPQRQGTVA